MQASSVKKLPKNRPQALRRLQNSSTATYQGAARMAIHRVTLLAKDNHGLRELMRFQFCPLTDTVLDFLRGSCLKHLCKIEGILTLRDESKGDDTQEVNFISNLK
jgi:hypothetical protein